ncbi:MAG: hypothetical protein CBB97_22410 [Candidatus Endolissoclinum sp. TMED37]|nr:MAG: hypothetical protein CBB97_22410 [Candidatus Endolissoclinum sp. TMED37]
MTTTVTQTKKERVLTALFAGEALTAGEMKGRYGVQNARALTSALRMEGYPVYLNAGGKDVRGRVRQSRYRLGAPTRAVVAAGYKALAQKG